jgi:hypothetical protein
MNLYSFKPHDHVRVERETLAEISHAYVGYCCARSTVRHSSIGVFFEGKEIGFVNAEGVVYGMKSPSKVIFDPKNPGATDVLATALRCDDLVDTYCAIVTALGIERTNSALKHFTIADRATFARLPNAYQKATFIASWLTAELDAAAERIHGFPIERTTQR